MKRIIIIVLSIALLLGVKFLFFPGNTGDSKGPSPKNKPAPAVKVWRIEARSFDQSLPVPGTLVAPEQVMLVPEMQGRIETIHFTEGQTVAKGQLLVTLNHADLRAQLAKIEAQQRFQTQRLERLEELSKLKGVSDEEREQAETALQQLDADKALVQAQIRKAEIRAPFHGTMGLRLVSEGSWVGPSNPVAQLVQMQPMHLTFSIPSRYGPQIDANQALSLSVEGDSTVYRARILAKEASVGSGDRMLKYKAEIAQTHATLLPGTPAQVQVPFRHRDDAILIPTQAVIPVFKGQKVFLVRQGKAVDQPIETGFRGPAEVEVLRGLQAGDSLIISGIQSLKSGSAVKVLPQTPSKP
jgi:membrane fusion protein (multidrug efflux system)